MKLSNISRSISNKISRNISHKIHEVPAAMLGGAAGLVSGAVGVWYFDEVQASPRRVALNQASTVLPTANLLTGPRRVFSRTPFWSNTGLTITDSFANGSDGKQFAARLVGGASWALSQAYTFPTATPFTFSCDLKSNTGSDQTVLFGFSSVLQTKTVTSSWQRFSQTITPTAGSTRTLFPATAQNTSGIDILVDNATLHAGSSDLGADTLDGHFYLGTNHSDTRPSIVSGQGVNFASTGYGLVQFDSALSLSAFTIFGCVKRTSSSSSPAFQPLLSAVGGGTNWTTILDGVSSVGPNVYMNGATVQSHTSANFSPNRLFSPLSDNYQVYAFRYNGSALSIWLDGVKCFETTVSGKTATGIADFWNLFAGTTYYSLHTYNAMALYDSALDDDALISNCDYLRQRAEGLSLGVGFTRFVCAEGDSLTAGGSGPSITLPYPLVFAGNSSPQCYGVKRAVGGSMLENNTLNPGLDLRSRATFNNAMIANKRPGVQYVYSFFVGRNDFNKASVAADPEGFADSLGQFCQDLKTAGWDKVVIGSIPPSTFSGFNTWRNQVNPFIQDSSWRTSNGVDAIFDIAANATIGGDAAASNATYYGDGTHGTQAWHDIVETLYRPAINSL